MCKVPTCWEKHDKHSCRLCKNKDSDHFTSDCPKGQILYHATQIQFVSAILKNGLKPSATGRMGPGIYFTTLEHVKPIAQHISQNRAKGSGIAIFKAQVLKDKAKKGIHPPWAGVKVNFPQYCLESDDQNKNHIVINVYLMDGEITENI